MNKIKNFNFNCGLNCAIKAYILIYEVNEVVNIMSTLTWLNIWEKYKIQIVFSYYILQSSPKAEVYINEDI